MAQDTEAELEQRMQRWFRETLDIDEERRIVRIDEHSILASKLPPGAAGYIYDVVDKVPEILDLEIVRSAYGEHAVGVAPETARVQAWHESTSELLRSVATEREIPETDQGLLQPGIDSVSSVMDAVLWTQPTTGGDYQPHDGERAAYRDVVQRIDGGADIFTRVFGPFEGRTVMNVCPGAPFARILLENTWQILTGTEVPAVEVGP